MHAAAHKGLAKLRCGGLFILAWVDDGLTGGNEGVSSKKYSGEGCITAHLLPGCIVLSRLCSILHPLCCITTPNPCNSTASQLNPQPTTCTPLPMPFNPTCSCSDDSTGNGSYKNLL